MFSLWIRLFVKNYRDIANPSVQVAYVRVVSWMGIVVNLIFGVIKTGYGVYYGAIALTSDGLDNFTNTLSSFILIISYKFTSSPASSTRPFGAGRAVYIANFSIALILGLTGIELIFFALEHLIDQGHYPSYNHAILWIVFISLIINEWQARFCLHVGKILKSDLLHTEGIHRRADNIFSLTVLIAWGASFYKIYWVDCAIGILFGIVILKSAYEIAKNNARELIGTPASPTLIDEILIIGKQIPQVLGIHEIVVHSYGAQTIASMHVEIDENLNLREAHLICDKLEDELQKQLHLHAITHADPSNIKDPSTQKIFQNKSRFLQHPYISPFIGDIGHIYVRKDRYDANFLFVSLDLFLKKPITKKDQETIHALLHPELEELLGQKIHLKLRPRPLFGANFH